jgi:hypothetical protein
MNKLLATLLAGLLAFSSGAIAQAPAPAAAPAAPARTAAPATAAAQTTVKAVQPGLFEVAGPRVNEVVAAGIQKIVATPGSGMGAIRVHSPWGDSYFGWPRNLKPVGFTIETGKPAGGATISAPGFTDANKADYRAAIEAIVPFAIARTNDNKAYRQHYGQ